MKSDDIFSLVLDATGEAALLINKENMRIVGSNLAACEVLGYSQTEFKNKDLSDLYTEEEMIPIWAKQTESFLPSVFFKRKDSSVLPVDIVKLDFNKIDSKSYQVYIIRDISAYKIAEQNIIESTDKLREANTAKDKFFAIVAHDLKNTLQALLIGSHLLTVYFNKKSYSKLSANITEINETVQNMSDLLENLLQWSKSQTGKIFYNPEILKISDIVDENINHVAVQAAKKDISIISDSHTKFYTYSDKFLFQAVLNSLLNNAIKFSNRGGNINISVLSIPGFFQINVTDNGIGIVDEDLKRLFKIDADLTRPGTENEEGAGIGLILCKEFVEKNGGTIFAKSQPGKGSVFSFTVPKLPDEIG